MSSVAQEIIDSRKHQRLQVRLAATVLFEHGRRYPVVTRDLSFGGGFVTGVSVLTYRGEPCQLQLYPATLNGPACISLRASVAGIREDGIALRFIASRAEDYENFVQLMLRSSPDPDWLQRELAASPGYLRTTG